MVALTEEARRLPAPTEKAKSGFRTDVQGLRAVAVGSVLLYHAGLPIAPGGYIGVDVFFVISGFLITGLLLKELETTGRISLTSFYARRARRILPAALLVLSATAILTYTLLPRTIWDEVGTHVIAGAFNVVNWVFAASEADYLQAGSAASPLQHFWTLSVEEQFYIVWPLLLVAVAYLAARGRRARPGRKRHLPANRLRKLLLSAVLIISVPSLIYSVYLTATDPGPAYFITTTRMYELGIGAAVAVYASTLSKLPNIVAVLLGWAGVAGIVAAAVLFTAETPFPGAAALVPTLGTAAVITAGMGGRAQFGVGRVLSVRPMTWIGDISYSLYLWHWPLVVIVGDLMNGLTVPVGLLVVTLSAVPAYLSYRYIERPFMSWDFVRSNTNALQSGLIGMILASLIGMIPLLSTPAVNYAPPAVVKNKDTGGESLSPYTALRRSQLIRKSDL